MFQNWERLKRHDNECDHCFLNSIFLLGSYRWNVSHMNFIWWYCVNIIPGFVMIHVTMENVLVPGNSLEVCGNNGISPQLFTPKYLRGKHSLQLFINQQRFLKWTMVFFKTFSPLVFETCCLLLVLPCISFSLTSLS